MSLLPGEQPSDKFGETTLSGQVIRAMRTLRELCADRGYTSAELETVSDDACVDAVAARQSIQVHVDPDRMIVVYMTSRHNGSTVRSDLKKRVNTDRHKHVLLVFREVPPNMDQVVSKLKSDMPGLSKVEVFGLADLQFNVTKHALVPKHEHVCDPKEIQRLMRAFGVQRKNQFPLIPKGDPVCKYLGVDAGSLVRVTRPSPTGGQHVAYRCCV